MLHIFIEAEFMNQNSALVFMSNICTCMWNLTGKQLKGPERKLKDRRDGFITSVVPSYSGVEDLPGELVDWFHCLIQLLIKHLAMSSNLECLDPGNCTHTDTGAASI